MTKSRNQHLQLTAGAVRVPETQNLSSVKLWCEYAIWGLLFYDDQSPWLTVVEALQICFHRKSEGEAVFTEASPAVSGEHEAITYRLRLNNELRHMLNVEAPDAPELIRMDERIEEGGP